MRDSSRDACPPYTLSNRRTRAALSAARGASPCSPAAVTARLPRSSLKRPTRGDCHCRPTPATPAPCQLRHAGGRSSAAGGATPTRTCDAAANHRGPRPSARARAAGIHARRRRGGAGRGAGAGGDAGGDAAEPRGADGRAAAPRGERGLARAPAPARGPGGRAGGAAGDGGGVGRPRAHPPVLRRGARPPEPAAAVTSLLRSFHHVASPAACTSCTPPPPLAIRVARDTSRPCLSARRRPYRHPRGRDPRGGVRGGRCGSSRSSTTRSGPSPPSATASGPLAPCRPGPPLRKLAGRADAPGSPR